MSIKQRNSINRIVRVCSKIIGMSLRDLNTFCEKQTKKKAKSILANTDHAMSSTFNYLPSGRRFKVITCKTIRRKASFVPTAVRLLNVGMNK